MFATTGKLLRGRLLFPSSRRLLHPRYSSTSLLRTIEELTDTFGLCRNRVWELVRNLQPEYRDLLLRLPSTVGLKVSQAGRHGGHEQCTFDFCERSRLDFTSVAQRHELASCASSQCDTRTFDTSLLEAAVNTGKPTAWRLDGRSLVEHPEHYMSISHVWADGTGTGSWPRGQVNSCLYDFFAGMAERFGCKGVWWDTICIPRTSKAVRNRAIYNMQQNYENARVTLVHDAFLREWEWTTPEAACFALAVSPWFSRGWTALELAKSHKVKVVFRDNVVKDLNEDILAEPNSTSAHHKVATGVIKNLLERWTGSQQLDNILRALHSRHTSWPRDRAIITGLLAGINVNSLSRETQQDIYQAVLRKIGFISHDHLFHGSITMSKGFSWCPASLFDMPISLDPCSLYIERNGDVIGNWGVCRVPDDVEKRCNWKGTHPLIQEKVEESLRNQSEEKLLLMKPYQEYRLLDVKPYVLDLSYDDNLVETALLVNVGNEGSSRSRKERGFKFIGSLHFHPPLTRQELSNYEPSLGYREETVQILGDAATGLVGGEHDSRCVTSTINQGIQASGSDSLLCASADGNGEEVALFLLSGCDPNVQDNEGNTPLHLAAGSEHDEVIAALLKHNANVDLYNKRKKTPLHIAAQKGHLKTLQRLVWNAADLDMQDHDLSTALHYATWNCYGKIVWELLQAGADPKICNRLGRNALHLAADRGHPGITSSILMYLQPADLETKDGDGQTPLHCSAWSGSASVTSLLLEKSNSDGEDWLTIIELLDNFKRSPLHIAADQGNSEVVRILLEHGAARNAQDTVGQTPVHLAAKNGHAEILIALIFYRAGKVTHRNGDHAGLLELRDSNFSTPLSLAVRNGHVKAVEALVGLCDVDGISGEDRRTPLMWAAEKGDLEMVRLLLSYGSDRTAKNIKGETPLSLATLNGHNEVSELLVN